MVLELVSTKGLKLNKNFESDAWTHQWCNLVLGVMGGPNDQMGQGHITVAFQGVIQGGWNDTQHILGFTIGLHNYIPFKKDICD